MISTQDKTILVEAVTAAGKMALAQQQDAATSHITKSSRIDFGVQADLDSEKTIFEALSKVSFPHRIVSEEAGKSGADTSEYVVFVDPIDGTVNYAKGIPTFCVSVAVYSGALEPVFSVVYAPASQELFVADGSNFFHNNHPVTRRTRIGVPFINFEGSTSPAFEEYAHKLVANDIRFRMMGCGVLGVTYTALGWGDACLILDNMPWDVATGLHFCQCMGLEIKSLSGDKVDLNQQKQRLAIYPKEMESIFSFLLKQE